MRASKQTPTAPFPPKKSSHVSIILQSWPNASNKSQARKFLIRAYVAKWALAVRIWRKVLRCPICSMTQPDCDSILDLHSAVFLAMKHLSHDLRNLHPHLHLWSKCCYPSLHLENFSLFSPRTNWNASIQSSMDRVQKTLFRLIRKLS